MRWSISEVWMIVLGYLSIWSVAVVGSENSKGPDDPCIDFATGNISTSEWTLADCTEIWTHFTDTIPESHRGRQHYADGWRETTMELRLAGSPCLCDFHGGGDGVGSMTMRILASWIFSEEMGCDWVTPEWRKKHVHPGNGTMLYCHTTALKEELENPSPSVSTLNKKSHCSVVNWLAFFQFNVPSVSLPEGAKLKELEVGENSEKELEVSRWSLNEGELLDEGWDRILFKMPLRFAVEYFTAVGNWDADRRQTVRTVIAQARRNFHMQPRPWYDENMECHYDQGRLNFALHIRMGDRRGMLRESENYFLLLELFMDTVSEEVVRRGLKSPIFHVFSETLALCPSEDTGLFNEFPSWPVHQVPECLTAEAPDNCLENQFGEPCSPDRSGIFDVIGMPVVLHLSRDAQNAMSCMIQADGLLMGCSTFGQVAGILSKGISFFSMHCMGPLTPDQYKAIPPIAVAERGHLWVPVTGSWRNPSLYSAKLMINALDTLLENKGLSSR